MKKYIYAIIFAFTVIGCSKDENSLVVSIASERYLSPLQDEMNAGVWFLSKKYQNDSWAILSRDIEGFVYERGYEYMIKVTVKATEQYIDQPPVKYILKKVISKERRDSDIPEVFRSSLYEEEE
ncbi:MAG: DUF4377 domain-containing protein [Bacteroidales bacterium]|nr:DUF4377 domain-containing protein [Bacteroidales bacterium]